MLLQHVYWHTGIADSRCLFVGKMQFQLHLALLMACVRVRGILSPFLFRFFICDLIDKITKMNVGCLFAGRSINLLAYADDMVLLAPSWRALQSLLVTIESAAGAIDMSFNTKKTVCMVFNPCDRHKIVCNSFPVFTLAGCKLLFVDSFKYLGHIIDNTMCDDKDIHRELKSLYTRTYMLARRFKRCSTQVKVKLFRSYCICMYALLYGIIMLLFS